MSIEKNYTIAEVDFEKDPNCLSLNGFYKNHVSQSLPLVMKGYAKNDKLTRDIHRQTPKTLNDFLENQFKTVDGRNGLL